jgi:hypothetical protein
MALPPGSDQTTDTDRALLAGAANAQLATVTPRHRPGGSEHPPGHVPAQPADPAEPSDAARREPRAGS